MWAQKLDISPHDRYEINHIDVNVSINRPHMSDNQFFKGTHYPNNQINMYLRSPHVYTTGDTECPHNLTNIAQSRHLNQC